MKSLSIRIGAHVHNEILSYNYDSSFIAPVKFSYGTWNFPFRERGKIFKLQNLGVEVGLEAFKEPRYEEDYSQSQ